jgi:hypothetical protein
MRIATLPRVAAFIGVIVATALATVARGQELTDKPETVLQKKFDATAVTVYGVKIGDPESAVPRDRAKTTTAIGRATRYDFGGYMIEVLNGKVKALAITDVTILDKIGLECSDDVERLIGKADRVDERTGVDGLPWMVLRYVDRRLTVGAGYDHVGSVVIR